MKADSMENRIANAEAYASHYCDARDFPTEAQKAIWCAVCSGFIEGDMHASFEYRRTLAMLKLALEVVDAARGLATYSSVEGHPIANVQAALTKLDAEWTGILSRQRGEDLGLKRSTQDV